MNHANLLLDLNQEGFAIELAGEALAALLNEERGDTVATQLNLISRRVICDAIGQIFPSLPPEKQRSYASEASDHADDALNLIQSIRQEGAPEPFAELSVRFYRYGARLYAIHQPHHLEEFLSEHLESLMDERLRPILRSIGDEAIGIALENATHQNGDYPEFIRRLQDFRKSSIRRAAPELTA